VVWIVIDSLRGDVIGNYGVTPHLENLQKEATVFQNHLVNASWTRPSTLVFFTGRYASRSPINFWDYPVPQEEVQAFQGTDVLPALLRDQGYKTIMIGNNPFLTDHAGIGVPVGFLELEDYSRFTRDTPLITKRALDFLESRKNKDEPFFLFLNYNDPHKPYTPPESHLMRVRGEFRDERQRLYLGEVSYIDSEIGQIVQALKDKNLWDPILFLVTSDHGEVMHPAHAISPFTGTDTYFGHGQDLFWETIHVPLLWKEPFQKKSQIYQFQTQSVDLFPSVLQTLGLPLPSDLDGISLQEQMQDSGKSEKDSKNAVRRLYYGETRFTQAVGQGDHWLLQRSYRFHRVSRFWESQRVGAEPFYYYNRSLDPNQEFPLRLGNPPHLETLAIPEETKSKIQNLIKYLREKEPKFSEYVLRKNQPENELTWQIFVRVGEIRWLQSPEIMEKLSPFLFRGKLQKEEEIRFTVYPDLVPPQLQVFQAGKPLTPDSWGLGSYQVRPDSCSRQCENLLWARAGAPAKNDSLMIQYWRTGRGLVLGQETTDISPEALDLLKKQGYVQ